MPSEPLEQTNEQLAVALETLAETMGNVGAELPFLFRLAAERLREPAHNIASLAIAYAEAHDAARAAGDAWRADVGNSDLWSRVRLTESALRTAARALLGNVRLRGATDVEVRAENARLQEQVRVLREELTTARLGAERRNKDLDALHLVWCNGGCNSGVHRYCGNKEEITEEVVALAEHHVKRLREWFQNYKFKNQRKVP
jgi:hypothetical protein